MKANSVLDTIGGTPHIRVNKLFGASHKVWIKSERSNPGGTVIAICWGSRSVKKISRMTGPIGTLTSR